jgi:hypothetical protein
MENQLVAYYLQNAKVQLQTQDWTKIITSNLSRSSNFQIFDFHFRDNFQTH